MEQRAVGERQAVMVCVDMRDGGHVGEEMQELAGGEAVWPGYQQ